MAILKPKQIDEIAHLAPGTAEAMVKQLETLSKGEQAVFTKALAHLAEGRRIPLDLLDDVLPLIEKLNMKYHVAWDELFDATLGNFRHRKLQEQYRAYLEKYKKTEAQVTPEQWARRTRGGPAKLLRLLMGDNFARLIGKSSGGAKVFVKLANVVRPASLDDIKLELFLNVLRMNPQLLTRKLEKYFADSEYSGSLVNIHHMNNAKGNIGEIFALVEQRAIVREQIEAYAILSFAKKIDLVTGIRIKGLEFSDNIIGFVDRAGNLNVIGIVEVKNFADARMGLEKAKTQFFEWLEENIDEGVTLTATYRGKQRKFIYDPSLAAGKVKGLFSSRKYILYIDAGTRGSLHRYAVGYSGSSPMGLNFDTRVHGARPITFDNGKRTVGQVQVRPVEGVTSAELDYLAALLIQSKGQL